MMRQIVCMSVLFMVSVLTAQTPERVATATRKLIDRIGVDKGKDVLLKVDPTVDGFSITPTGKNKLVLSAARAGDWPAAYGYYLKHLRGVHWSWSASRLRPTSSWRDRTSVRVKAPWQMRYAYNYCTLSYTSAFWGEREWGAELDRMALNGATHLLVQAGLEKVWQLTLKDAGYPAEKIIAFIPNPAAAAWWNMGNLEGHGGPLTQRQIDTEAALGVFIVNRMLDYGMTPVLQGFTGLVPHDFGDYFKPGDARYIPQGNWCGGFTRPALLDPTTTAFQTMAALWYKNLKKVYGIQGTMFGGDLFHEGGRSGGVNVTAAAKAVAQAMQKASPESTWLLQNWGGNPSRALLNGLDPKRTIILALRKNLTVAGLNLAGQANGQFKGFPLVWCELSNFGGNQGLYGGFDIYASFNKLQNVSTPDQIIGVGIIAEGTEINPLPYDLFYDRWWMDKTHAMDDAEKKAWIKDYARRRYGRESAAAEQALALLVRSVYTPNRDQEGCTESILCARPGRNVQKASTWSTPNLYWDPNDVFNAARLLVKAGRADSKLAEESTFRYDLADVTRQVLADLARPLLQRAMARYDADDREGFNEAADDFLNLIIATDRVLSTHRLWTFGRMTDQAVAKGTTPAERENNLVALRRMVTTWSGRRDSLNDYAHRQLSGLMDSYYRFRWTMFFDAHRKALAGELKKGDVNRVINETLNPFEIGWAAADPLRFDSKPQLRGNTLAEADAILSRVAPFAKEFFTDMKPAEEKKWTLRDGATEFTFDVSDVITAAGTFSATFTWREGSSALTITRVALYEGDTLVSEDVHDGSTGWKHEKNTYTLTVKTLRTNLAAYTVRATVRGASGTDSAGVFTFTRVKNK